MNHPAYFEIQSSDPQRDIAFYSQVFGWKFTEDKFMPMEYHRIETSGMNGALMKRPAPLPADTNSGSNAFTMSMQVADFDTCASSIASHGGTVLIPKFTVPNTCHQGYFFDPDGNAFGIFEVLSNSIP